MTRVQGIDDPSDISSAAWRCKPWIMATRVDHGQDEAETTARCGVSKWAENSYRDSDIGIQLEYVVPGETSTCKLDLCF
jgi:hypothetical protein